MKYIILLLIFLPSVVIADPYTIEIRISAFSLKDQHGNQQEVDETTHLILFNKDTGVKYHFPVDFGEHHHYYKLQIFANLLKS